jgi:hypothetical protein
VFEAVPVFMQRLHACRNSLKHSVEQPWKQHENKVAKRVSFFQVWDTTSDVLVLLFCYCSKYLSINILPLPTGSKINFQDNRQEQGVT